MFETMFNADGSVTVWDVYSQQWITTSWPGDKLLSGCNRSERVLIGNHVRNYKRQFHRLTSSNWFCDIGETFTAEPRLRERFQVLTWFVPMVCVDLTQAIVADCIVRDYHN